MTSTRKKTLLVFAVLALFGAGLVSGIAANQFNQPKSVLHFITVQWKEGSTPEQQKAAVDGVRKMAAGVPGLTNVWLKTLKVQGGANAIIAMEFKDQASFDAYADNAAHKEWEKVYIPVRPQHDVRCDQLRRGGAGTCPISHPPPHAMMGCILYASRWHPRGPHFR